MAVLAVSLMTSMTLLGAEAANPPVALPKAYSASSNTANYSYAITEVIKMADAKVSPAVIKDFIQVSVSPFQATASDIIALKERGIPEDLIQAMLQRDATLQELAARTSPSASRPMTAQTAPPLTQPVPTVAVPQYAPSTVYYDTQPVATYAPTTYYYNYPAYYPSYVYSSWGWPWYSYSFYRRPAFYGGFHGHGYIGGGYVSGYHGGGWGHGPVGHPGGHPGGFGGGHGGGGHRGR
ncbi:MAG TPA: hypothetical protein VMF06_05765 [Candidatus Limnocylindria bacterium]|nr:hypothetical protein [Candidatus Limnocylindria bacterium]